MVGGDYPKGLAVAEWRQSWTLVLSGFSLSSLSALSMVVLGVMIAPMEQETGWSRVEITSGPALISITGILFSTVVGIAIDRLGFRRIGLVTTFLMFASTGLMSSITNDLWTWLACWSLFGLAAAATPGVYIVPIVSTFHASRGLALIVTAAGTSLTTTLAPSIAAFLIDNFGWRVGYAALALIWGAFAIPLMYLFFRIQPPTKRKDEATSESSTSSAREELPGVTIREGLMSPVFYKLLVGSTCSNVVGTVMAMNVVPILTLQGLSRTAAAAAAGVLGLSMLIGKAICAIVLDRVDAKLIAGAASAGAMTMPLLFLMMPGSFTAAATGIAIYGAMSGFKGATNSYLISRHLGARSFGTMTGTINAFASVMIGLAPIGASFVYDTTRSYDLVLWLSLPTLMISSLLYLSLGRYPDEFPQREAILPNGVDPGKSSTLIS